MHLLSLIAADSKSSSAGFVNIAILLVIPVAMYFLLIRPQRRRQRAAANLQSSIEIGDEVMTTSGMYGFVTGFDGDIAWLEIDDNVQMRVARAAIQRRVDTAQTAAEDAAAPEAKPRQTKIEDAATKDAVDGDIK